VPSALAMSMLHLTRRFLLGQPAANPLEVEGFGILDRMSPAMRDVLSCALEAFDELPPRLRGELFEPSLHLSPDQAIDADRLSTAWAQEVVHRVGLLTTGLETQPRHRSREASH